MAVIFSEILFLSDEKTFSKGKHRIQEMHMNDI